MEYRATVHEENGAYWAEVRELPGCFASGETLDELKEAVVEAITLYIEGDQPPELTDARRAAAQIGEIRVLLPM